MIRVDVKMFPKVPGQPQYIVKMVDGDTEVRRREFKGPAQLKDYMRGLRDAATVGKTEFGIGDAPRSLELFYILPDYK